MFSVIIPLYNKELSIRNTLQSVLDQTFTDFEIVIVNDGSTDSSVAVVEEFTDSRIRLIHQENQGVSAARNRGIQEATNQWVAFLDADDLWMDDHLKTLYKMTQKHPEEKVFATSYIRSNQDFSNSTNNSIRIIENYFTEALKGHFVWTGVICVNKEVFDEVGNFNINICRGEDLDLWARIGREYKYILSKKITSIYKIDSENRLTGNKSNYHQSILSTIKLKGKEGDERKYLRNMLRKRIVTNVKHLDLKEIIIIIFKHNIELLR